MTKILPAWYPSLPRVRELNRVGPDGVAHLITIVVLGSGLYLWLKRGRAAKAATQGREATRGTPALARTTEPS